MFWFLVTWAWKVLPLAIVVSVKEELLVPYTNSRLVEKVWGKEERETFVVLLGFFDIRNKLSLTEQILSTGL